MIKPQFNDKEWVIGVDLHGTLLNREWQISPDLLPELISVLSLISEKSYLFVCSGNDLSFIEDVLPAEIRTLLHGYILENGCVFSNGFDEELLIPVDQIDMIRTLESELKELNLPDVLFFGRRLGTVSLFTKNRDYGISPHNLYLFLKEVLQSRACYNYIHITHSDVAVDIIPVGYSKYAGLAQVCPNNKIIAIADSCNDWEFLSRAELSFLPQNICSYLEEKFREQKINVVPLSAFNKTNVSNTVYISDLNYTNGVIDILNNLNIYL